MTTQTRQSASHRLFEMRLSYEPPCLCDSDECPDCGHRTIEERRELARMSDAQKATFARDQSMQYVDEMVREEFGNYRWHLGDDATMDTLALIKVPLHGKRRPDQDVLADWSTHYPYIDLYPQPWHVRHRDKILSGETIIPLDMMQDLREERAFCRSRNKIGTPHTMSDGSACIWCGSAGKKLAREYSKMGATWR